VQRVSERIPLIVHMSHEAGINVGGVGAVLHGLLGAATYAGGVARTLLVGPLDARDAVVVDRLLDPTSGVRIAYSSAHGICQGVDETLRGALGAIERQYGVTLLYGTRTFGGSTCEVILADPAAAGEIGANPEAGAAGGPTAVLNRFKFDLWERFGLDSARHEGSAEYNRSLAVARPLLGAIAAVVGGGDTANGEEGDPGGRVLIGHEWLALPLLLAAQIDQPRRWRTIFYAHETATVRRLVEERPGHDTSFYNAMFKAKEWNLSLEAVYGSQEHDYKHGLLRLATHCDAIFAVGDVMVGELRFLGGRFANSSIEVVYNGSSAEEISLSEKAEAKGRLQQYAERLLGYRPDYIFTHVGRMALSKAYWRDLRLLEHLRKGLRKRGQTAVLFVLASSLAGGRRPQWVFSWEEEYGWPVAHREGNGDLAGLERTFYFDDVLPFNAGGRGVQAIFVNQYGFSRERCGVRMPPDMTFADLRRGTDVEFGQSIYEPFGIATVEALTYGALCCLASMCGAIGFVERAAAETGGRARLSNLVVADYVTLPQGYWMGSPYDALGIDQGIRDWIEGANSERAAHMLLARLPQNDEARAALLASGHAAAAAMSWDVVARDYFLPAVARVLRR
jgi:hypothetical protein